MDELYVKGQNYYIYGNWSAKNLFYPLAQNAILLFNLGLSWAKLDVDNWTSGDGCTDGDIGRVTPNKRRHRWQYLGSFGKHGNCIFELWLPTLMLYSFRCISSFFFLYDYVDNVE